jgi:hypothetical protein
LPSADQRRLRLNFAIDTCPEPSIKLEGCKLFNSFRNAFSPDFLSFIIYAYGRICGDLKIPAEANPTITDEK